MRDADIVFSQRRRLNVAANIIGFIAYVLFCKLTQHVFPFTFPFLHRLSCTNVVGL